MSIETLRAFVDAYRRAGSVRKAAELLGVSKDRVWRAVKQYEREVGPLPDPIEPPPKAVISTHTHVDEIVGETRTITSGQIKTLEDLLEAAKVDPSEWVVRSFKANAWASQAKGGDVVQLHQVTAHLERAPSFWVQPVVPPSMIKRIPRPVRDGVRCALIVPDIQAGFRRIEDRKAAGGYRWEPLHDRRAMDCVLQVAQMLSDEIDTVIYLGDNLDLSPWSGKYTSDVNTRFTTNQTLRELYATFLRPLREILPHSEQKYAAGNHEQRIDDLLAMRLGEATTLTRADEPDSLPVMDVASLLALDSLDIEYIGRPYGRPLWLYDSIRIVHGFKVGGPGKTAAKYLSDATSSIIWGHTHRLEVAMTRKETPDGPRFFQAGSPGCLCRTDFGIVPGRAGNSYDWQNGFMLVYEKDGRHQFVTYPIIDGRTFIDGCLIEGKDDEARRQALTGLKI